jgi:hypothetical protein
LSNISMPGYSQEPNVPVYLRKGQYAQPCVIEQEISEDMVLRDAQCKLQRSDST